MRFRQVIPALSYLDCDREYDRDREQDRDRDLE